MTVSGISAVGKGASSSVKTDENQLFAGARKKGSYYVKSGTTLYSLSKYFGMKADDFKEKYKITDLKAGAQISNLPTVQYKSGKLRTFVENELGMDFKAFCALNNIPENYQPVKGEKFFGIVTKKETTQKPQHQDAGKENTKADAKPKTEVKQETEVKSEPKADKKPKEEAVKPDSPEGIAQALKKSANKWGAVGKEAFNVPFSQINKDNVIEVIKSYDSISPHESLIEMIVDEVTSKTEDKKDAVIKLYDTLAERVGKNIATPERREEFITELENQYKGIGFVSTDKLDKIINSMAGLGIAEENDDSYEVITGEYTPLDDENGSKKIYIQNIKEMKTLESLRKDSVNSGKKEIIKAFDTFCYIQSILKYCENNNITYNDLKLDFNNPAKIEEFCKQHGLSKTSAKLDLSDLDRPLPNLDTSGTKITTYVSEPLKATGKGALNGKTIIVNPGHGGYDNKNGFFDPGAFSFVKTGKHKYKPIQEFEVLDNYTKDLIGELRDEGADVVIMRGHINTFFREETAGKLAQKYSPDAMFISLHCDKEMKKGSGVLYHPADKKDVSLEKSLMQALGEKFENVQEFPRDKLNVLKTTRSIPSVLLEVEYLNGLEDSRILDEDYREDYISAVMEGIKQYYKED